MDQTHDTRLVASGAQQLDVRIVSGHLAGEAVEHAVEFHPFDVDDQTIRTFDHEMGEFKRRIVFERHARVIGRRPDTHREHRRQLGYRARQRRKRQDQRGASAAQ